MTEPLDTAAIRAKHAPTLMYGDGMTPVCSVERTEYPCLAVRLCERLRRVECVHLWVLEIDETETWIRCVNCDARTTQSEAPTVSDTC